MSYSFGAVWSPPPIPSHPHSHPSSPPQSNLSHSQSSAAGSSASSSLSNVPPEARSLSSALGVQSNHLSGLSQSAFVPKNTAQPTQQTMSEQSRTMSVEMADVSGLTLQNNAASGTGRQNSADEERMREKAREAQEQVDRAPFHLRSIS